MSYRSIWKFEPHHIWTTLNRDEKISRYRWSTIVISDCRIEASHWTKSVWFLLFVWRLLSLSCLVIESQDFSSPRSNFRNFGKDIRDESNVTQVAIRKVFPLQNFRAIVEKIWRSVFHHNKRPTAARSINFPTSSSLSTEQFVICCMFWFQTIHRDIQTIHASASFCRNSANPTKHISLKKQIVFVVYDLQM